MPLANLKLQTRSSWVKSLAGELGFTDCRIASAGMLDKEAAYLESWLKAGRHGSMQYLENYFDLRTDPRRLVEGAKSVVVLSLNYYPQQRLPESGFKLSKYAYGRDYHKVIKGKFKQMIPRLREQFGEINVRGFVDSAPVLEKAWARKAGIGWMGKHTNVITKQQGSFYFLAVLITDLELAADEAVEDHCGSCTACIDACPTGAIIAPYELDAARCISYFTIELKDQILPDTFKGKFNQWIFGCDICQDVCPWNRFSKPHVEPDFKPSDALSAMDKKDWIQLEEKHFKSLFAGSAVMRTKYSGLTRNIRFINLSDQSPEPGKT